MAFGARLVWVLVVASVLASGTVACSPLLGAPFVILFGRVRSIEIDEDHFLGKQ